MHNRVDDHSMLLSQLTSVTQFKESLSERCANMLNMLAEMRVPLGRPQIERLGGVLGQ